MMRRRVSGRTAYAHYEAAQHAHVATEYLFLMHFIPRHTGIYCFYLQRFRVVDGQMRFMADTIRYFHF